MKNHKKLILLFFALMLSVSVLHIARAEEGKATVSFSMHDPEKTYMAGDTINMDVMLSNNPGKLSKLVVSVSYDSEILEYTGISFKDSILSTWNTKLWNASPKQIWMATNSVSQYSSADRLVCTLSFRALAATGGTRVTPSSISMNSSNMSMTGYRYGAEAVTISIAEYTPSVIPVSGITLNKDSVMLIEGAETTLSAAVTPENATDPTVVWSSNNKSVAAVEQNGKIKALAEGSAVITARAGNMTAHCQVTVQSNTPELKKGYIVDLDTPETNVAPGANVPVTVSVSSGSEDTDRLKYYNAMDMTVAYDRSKLTFLGIADNSEDYKVTDRASDGTVRLQRFGSKMSLGKAVTLNFQTAGNASGSAEILFVNAYLDKSENAALDDAPPAIMRNRVVTLLIGSESAVYHVNLPAGYEAGNSSVATPAEDYVFTLVKDGHYDYTVKASINGNTITLADKEGNGQYLISAGRISGDVTITVEKTPRAYSVVTLGNAASDVALTGGSSASYGTPYTFTITCEAGYQYSIVMTAGDSRIFGVNPTENGNVYTYTIPGEKITGTVSINVSKSKKGSSSDNSGNDSPNGGNSGGNSSNGNGISNGSGSNSGNSSTGSGNSSGNSSTGSGSSSGTSIYRGTTGGSSTYTGSSGSVLNGQQTVTAGNNLYVVTFSGSAKDLLKGSSTVKSGEDYTFEFTGENKENYVITAAVDGREAEIIDNEDGTYTVKAVAGNLKISAEPTEKYASISDMELKIYRYLKLDGKDMYLITVKGDPGTGNVFVYDLNPMYYSEKYGAYCYLVISDQDENQTLSDAEELITTGVGNISTIYYDGDINGSKRVDINDMQLVYNMYNAKFDDFTAEASMLKFLRADLAADPTSRMKLDVSDVLAVYSPVSKS